MLLRLCVVVDNLEKIMLAVFEDHKYTFILEDNLHEVYKVRVG